MTRSQTRSDPYQTRARELALAAGLNPDDRIERPGQRSMPVWCNFRQAARDEHIAQEAAALTPTIAPQKPEYANSPLLVLGSHDYATITQMQNCMRVGNAVAGVICADGHLGYAQPVGGVIAYEKQIKAQLGTVGAGNHYVDLMTDADGFVWIGVHFGSRGLGHTSATRYLKAAGGQDGMNVPPAVVDEDSELGARYLAAMQLAGRYAYAGREWVVDRVRQIIGGSVTDSVHNHHNYAWRESHHGKPLWVVRKGATPAFPGQRGFVGGSMGDDAVIVEGVDSPDAEAALYSTIHGAGRVFGRKEAKRRFTREQMDAWLNARGVTLVGADLDESPMAYRRLEEVLDYHRTSVKVLHRLKPFVVAMAGNETDPWKD